MNDYNDTDDLLNDENEDAKKKKKKGEGDGVAAREIAVGEEFYAKMASMGAPASLIASVLKSWRHLRGDGLRRALVDFIQKTSTRATAHVEVNIDKNKNFSLLENIISYLKSLGRAPEQHHRMDNRNNRFDPK